MLPTVGLLLILKLGENMFSECIASRIVAFYRITKIPKAITTCQSQIITDVIVKNRIKAHGNKNRLYEKLGLFWTRTDHALVSYLIIFEYANHLCN